MLEDWKDEKGDFKWKGLMLSILALPFAFYIGVHIILFLFQNFVKLMGVE